LSQTQAHDYYPTSLWRASVPLGEPLQAVEFAGNRGGSRGKYAHDLFTMAATNYIRVAHYRPFFLYLPYTIPHANNEMKEKGMQVPSDEPYTKETWPQPEKNKAAMITRMDRDIGRILALLKELKLDDNTLVFFTSDNGPNPPFNKFFASDGGFRGIKRTMYEGGLREPTAVRWPGHVPAGQVSDEPWIFYDFLPTIADVLQVPLPPMVKPDGISILPALLHGQALKRDFIYWELHEVWTQQAVRFGDWKAVRVSPDMPVELYDLKTDPQEKHDVGKDHPEELKRATDLLKSQHVEDPNWPTKNIPPARKKKLQAGDDAA